MNKRLILALAVACCTLPFAAQAQYGDRRLNLIDDPLKVSFMGEPGKLTREQVRQAVEVASLAKDWKTVKAEDGRIELRTTKNGRHLLHVAVAYDAAGCEIRYVDSVDMMYQDKGDSLRVIHRNYNVWIRDLANTIVNRVGQPASVIGPPEPVAVRKKDPDAAFTTKADPVNTPQTAGGRGSNPWWQQQQKGGQP